MSETIIHRTEREIQKKGAEELLTFFRTKYGMR